MACTLFPTKASASNEKNRWLLSLMHTENLCLLCNTAILGLVLLLPPHYLFCGPSLSSVPPKATPYCHTLAELSVQVYTHGKFIGTQCGIHNVKAGEMVSLFSSRNKDTDIETKNTWSYMREKQRSHSLRLSPCLLTVNMPLCS